MSDSREVLSALIDREPVDADVLAQVLEDPANRAMLVDFVRVRLATLAEGPDERAWRPDASAMAGLRQAPGSGLRASAAPDGSRLTAHGSRRWLRAAAVFLLVAAGAGGGAWLEHYASRERPPEPDRIVRLEPIPGRLPGLAPSIDGRQP